MEEAKAEWERASKMTDEDRLNEREKMLTERENALKINEARSKARMELAKRGLPAEFADIMAFDSGEDNVDGLDVIEKTFRTAVQESVMKRLAGSEPKISAPVKDYKDMTDEEYYSYID